MAPFSRENEKEAVSTCVVQKRYIPYSKKIAAAAAIMRKLLPTNTSPSTCVSMRMLQVGILVLILVYVAINVQLHHRHRHHQVVLLQHQHHQQPHLFPHNATTINIKPETNDNKAPTVDEEDTSITVAVGYFPNAARPNDERNENDDDVSSQEDAGGGNKGADDRGGFDNEQSEEQEEVTVDWEDLYKRGKLVAHSCRLRKNEPNITFLQAPDFIIAGVQKAGTTALFALLSCK
jgi:hypothetical protein